MREGKEKELLKNKIAALKELEENRCNNNTEEKFYDTALRGSILALSEMQVDFPFSDSFKEGIIKKLESKTFFNVYDITEDLQNKASLIITPNVNTAKETLSMIKENSNKREEKKLFKRVKTSDFMESFGTIKEIIKKSLSDIKDILNECRELIIEELSKKIETLENSSPTQGANIKRVDDEVKKEENTNPSPDITPEEVIPIENQPSPESAELPVVDTTAMEERWGLENLETPPVYENEGYIPSEECPIRTNEEIQAAFDEEMANSPQNTF